MSTSEWTADRIRRIGAATELQIASHRPDGTLRRFVPIRAVVTRNRISVRSVYDSDSPWFRRGLASGRGRTRIGGVERDVEFVHLDAGDQAHSNIDAAYYRTYDRYGPAIVGSVTGDHATHITARLDRR